MRNIVVCCDGTGNEISENISNVLKLYRVLRKTGKTEPRQIVYYDPGVGTLARPDPWTKFRQDAVAVLGLVTGYGLDDNVLAAYEFLVEHYEEGDSIYLFGFSRGAYSVRVLAALVHKVGLLAPQQRNLSGAALTAYKQTVSSDHDTQNVSQVSLSGAHEGDQTGPTTQEDRASQFSRIVSTRWPTVRFVGVWDTVASVIVPRPDRFYTFSIQELPNTRSNPSVMIFRQAIAIDERRRMFRLDPWDQPQNFMHNRFSRTNNLELQDIQQVWFAGVHGDIGGGYAEEESGLSKFPLLWMIGEAVKAGLSVDARTVNQLAWGVQRKNSPFSYVEPNENVVAHDSMSRVWRALEWIPKADKYKDWQLRRSFLGHYLPRCEPRSIPIGAFVHESVERRMNSVQDYRPINLPSDYQVVKMPIGPRSLTVDEET
ncbi:DUF2235 domain-containing protein [Tardiphaga sp. 20_F10_N6_6]|uniref:DUF2235 domain-containing protein n=1 Tax=Tardiphaga sp. 20_F10_N6_6 TaxID=3240788 RepID=UPI003F8999EB